MLGLLRWQRQSRWRRVRLMRDLLAGAVLARRAGRRRLLTVAATVAGIGVMDLLAGLRTRLAAGRGTRELTKSITVNAPADAVYGLWRDFSNLPRFMANLESVQRLDERRTRWEARGPAGKRFTWEAELVEDVPSRLIAWRSVGKSAIPNAGELRFEAAPGGRGTEVHVKLQYRAPGGVFGATIAKLLGKEPGQQVEGELRRFKQVAETGEVVHSDASIYDRPHPARPAGAT